MGDDPYLGREQTKAKHFILKHYLQALAFKLLGFSDLAYVDGFSGPWETKTGDHSDSSFMIAISVLKDAQEKIATQRGVRPKVRCFFSEKDKTAYAQLEAAVAPHRTADFEIETFCGEFESAVPRIQAFIGRCFPLIFVDPTGWTGFAFDKIKGMFGNRCEVLINFMYDFINRAASMSDPKTVASLEPILGGAGWEARLDGSLPRGLAVEKLFRETLKSAGKFDFVISTKIDRATKDRPHFFLAYATKSEKGLEAFRETEYAALRAHARDRSAAKERKRMEDSGSADLFAGADADVQELSIDDLVDQQKKKAEEALLKLLKIEPVRFAAVWRVLLQSHMLRVTNVKDICVDLAKRGVIKNSWGGGNRKPRDADLIELT